MRQSIERYEALVSVLASLHDRTCDSLRAISIIASHAIHIPPTSTTRCTSSTTSSISHITQNSKVARLNVRPPSGMPT